MATSGLTSALSPSGGLLGSPEDDAYKTALQKMKSALDMRENRMFDPQLMALAQGFLSPTKTGSFGESLGQAAGNVIPVMQSEEKAGMENAQLRLQVAQAERAQANKLRALGMGFGTPSSGGAPTQGAAPTQGGGQQSNTISVGGQQFPASFLRITPEIALQAGVLDEATGKLYSDYIKLRNEGFKVQPGGFVDVNNPTGPKYTPFGGKALVQRVVPGVGKIDMPEEDAMALDEARRQNDGPKYWSIVDAVSKPLSREAKPATAGAAPAGAAPTGAAPTGATTVGDARTTTSTLEADAAAAKERATVMAKSEAERTNMVLDTAKSARGSQATYARAQEILATPGIDKVMGLVNKGDVVSGITNLVTDSLKFGNYTVGVPAIKKILTDSGVPQNLLDKALELAQLEAMWQMESRKGLGAGTSVSNMEQQMANRITPSQDDPMGAYKQKLGFLQEKAKFDVQLARELKRSKLSYDQFEDTKEFESIFNDYQNRLMNIMTGKITPTNRSNTQTSTTTQTGPITVESLKNRLNPKPTQ